jgi:hypothetical protein
MKWVNHVANCLAFALIIGCSPSPKNTKTTQEKPVYKQQKNKTTHQHVTLKKQEPNKDLELAEVHGDIRRYYTLSYRNIVGYDTLTSQLSICKNVFTFFVENPDVSTIKRFRNDGFPIEFWSTNMCSFYGVPSSQVKYFIKKANKLGYRRVGYDAELFSETDSTRFIASNRFNVHFDRRTAQEDLNHVLQEIKGLRLEGGSLDYAFVVSVTSYELPLILEKFKQLNNHRLVRFVEFIPEDCGAMY